MTDTNSHNISWTNTQDRYGKMAMIMHWSVALLFLCLYATVYFRRWFTDYQTDINWLTLQLHLSFGITVAVFVGLRIIYKLWDKSPDEVPGNKMERVSAKLGHLALYGVMIIMPVTGYFGTGVNTDFFNIFEITQFRETAIYQWFVIEQLQLNWETFEPPIDFIHKQGGATLVWMLIGVHVLAAIYHHICKKDNVLRRMLPVSLRK